ncbi:MAG: PTS transporter subunit EIIC, partial [Oscillospiraceae bacterium]|nr:PTS transporter subunit EIIC [Oscillospiraceae bacterium]
GSTGVGEGIAIPHGKTDAVTAPALAAMTAPGGVDFQSLDGEPADVFFLIAAPNNEDNVHLEVLSKLSMLLMHDEFRLELLETKTPEEFLAVVDKYEVARDEAEKAKEAEKAAKAEAEAAAAAAAAEEKAAEETADDGRIRVLAVTACPTGIAHTYMAAEALDNAGKKLGISVKVETNGSGGIKNALTRAEIEACDAIIVAADKNVETARFDGKPVIICKVADGIKMAEELVTRAAAGDAPIFHADKTATDSKSDEGEQETAGRKIYKHLMNGVSNMLPFVIGGGILIALAFLFDNQAINPANFGKNTPFAAFLKTIGETAFNFMLPILAGYIAYSIADRPGLAVGFVGGYLASTGTSFWTIAQGVDPVPAGFLGALLAGFVGGYMMLGMRKICDKLPSALEGIKPILIYPLCGILLMGAFMCLINPVMSLINTGLTNFLNSLGSSSRIILGAVLGAMMSIDMGGPFNKAAYVTGTGAIATAAAAGAAANDIAYQMMASVMIGGMIPPIAIALACTFFKRKFTEDERKSGLVNYIMGLCFITEGAIPFAVSDPLRVIPSCACGAAVGGALSMLMGCTLPAPHGGIFVFPVVGNPFGYIIALLGGAVVGALLLGLLKKNVD